MLQTFVKGMVPHKNVPIAVSINKTTTLTTIKELQECGVFGIIPVTNEFGFEEAIKGVEALFNRIPYWPKHVIDKLPNDKKPKAASTTGITLTPRQQQIFKLVSTRGASNKVIAKTLKITESTVKAHVSAILKAYGVRNRTQLVVSANHNP
jgi:DNA-binding NarL/FixJ family response regulator